MVELVPQAEIAAAESYDRLMVPAVTAQWAPRVAEAARIAPGWRVLDVACGTGVLSRHVASIVGSAGRVVGLDAGAGMLQVAKQRAPGLEWQQGSADALPFADRAFDAVVCQFGLMFFADRRLALQEALRVLRPGRRFVFAVWNAIDTMPVYAEEARLVERVAGTRAADPIRRPFALGVRGALVDLCRDAGAGEIDAATVHGQARFPSVRVLIESDVRGWLPLMGIRLDEEAIAAVLAEAERVLQPNVATDGTLTFEISAHIVSGRRPA